MKKVDEFCLLCKISCIKTLKCSCFLLSMQEASVANIAKTKLTENLKKLQVLSYSYYNLHIPSTLTRSEGVA